MKMIRTLFISTALLISGCATMVSESEYGVRLNSTPDANFVVYNSRGFEIASGVTPETVLLPSGDGFFRSAKYIIEYRREGYSIKSVELRPTVDGWVFGNIIVGGLIGLVIDGATGAIYALPSTTNVRLEPTTVGQLHMIDYADLSEAMKSELIALN